jgi:outer membrane receptor for ferrienterochelin and colicin
MKMNINKVFIAGSDVMLKYHIGFGFSVSGGYNYLYSYDKQRKDTLFGAMKHSGNFSIEYSYKRPKYEINAMLYDKIDGKKIFLLPEQNYYVNEPVYHMWRFSLSQKFYSKFSLVLGIENLFDYVNTETLSNISPGRTYFVQFIMDLKFYGNN